MLTRLLIAVVYFFPTIVAFAKKHRSKGAIAVGNAFFGWTGIGWLVFLMIAADVGRAKGSDGELVKVNDSDKEEQSVKAQESDDFESDHPEVKELNALFREIRMKAKPKVREHASQALSQLKMLVRRYEGLLSTLGMKLNPKELTYGRYADASAQVFNSVIVNLSICSSLMRSVDGINSAHIEDRLESLSKILSKHEADLEEIQTLTERKELLTNQMDKINILLTKNEVALTKLDKLNAALAEMNIVGGRVPSEFDSSINEMEKLVQRVKLYDESPVEWEPAKKNKDKITT